MSLRQSIFSPRSIPACLCSSQDSVLAHGLDCVPGVPIRGSRNFWVSASLWAIWGAAASPTSITAKSRSFSCLANSTNSATPTNCAPWSSNFLRTSKRTPKWKSSAAETISSRATCRSSIAP